MSNMQSNESEGLEGQQEVRVILCGVVGSTAYGLSTPTSDVDRIGIFQKPTVEILGRWGESKSDSHVTTNPDIQLHELGKYMRLASQGNPTASELLWLDSFEIQNPVGKLLVENRHLFLSQQARARYVGYAGAQVKRLLSRGDFDSDLKKRTQKHGRHCARLLIQAEQILKECHLSVRLSEEDAAWCFEMGHLAEDYAEAFSNLMEFKIRAINEIKSPLPERPDMDAIRDLLVVIRIADL